MDQPKKSKTAPITDKQTISEAFGVILRHNFEYMQSWAATAYDGKDIEGSIRLGLPFVGCGLH